MNSTKKRYWYKEGIWYELYINLFYDSNNDGIGDIPGIIAKIPYLKKLGVDTLLILPFFPSTMKDYGYDITDYYNIREELGDIEQFKTLVKTLQDNDIRVVIDLVMNHTSFEHPWFKQSERNIGKYKDYYLWEKNIDKFNDNDILFNSEESSNWEYSKKRHEYYFHKFYKYQADLNWKNPLVFNEFLEIISFYINIGVSGFRIDAAPFLIKDSKYNTNYKESIKIIKKLKDKVTLLNKDVIFITEVPDSLKTVLNFFKSNQMSFNFDLMPRLLLSIKEEDKKYLEKKLPLYERIINENQFGNFLRNHDSISLNSLSKKERILYFKKLNSNNSKVIFSGEIVERLISVFDDNIDKVILAYAILLVLSGTPIIYMGDERGQKEINQRNYTDGRMIVRGKILWNENIAEIFEEMSVIISMRKEYIVDIVYSDIKINEKTPLLSFKKNNLVFLFNLQKVDVEIENKGRIIYKRNITIMAHKIIIKEFGILFFEELV